VRDKYEEYSQEELLRLLRERDHKPRFGLVWERDEIEHDRSLNDDFVVLEADAALSVGEAPHRNLVIEGDNFDALRYLLNSGDTLDKVLASHQLYKRPVMLLCENGGRVMTIRQNAMGTNEPDQVFRVDLMPGYL
jgi:hypothetical protein